MKTCVFLHILNRQLFFMLIASDSLVFSTVIFICTPYILSKSSQSRVANENSYLQNTLDKILSKSRQVNELAYEFRHQRRQIHKQQYRQTHTQHHRYRRDDRAELVPQLIVKPLFKLGLLLLIVLRHLLLSRPCKALVAVYKRSKEAENAPHKRRFPVPRRIFSAFYRPLL